MRTEKIPDTASPPSSPGSPGDTRGHLGARPWMVGSSPTMTTEKTVARLVISGLRPQMRTSVPASKT